MWLILSFMEFSKSQPLKIHTVLLSVPFFTSWQKVLTPAISFIGFITYMSMMKTNGCLTLSKRLKSNTDSNKIWLCENYYTIFLKIIDTIVVMFTKEARILMSSLKSQYWLDIFLWLKIDLSIYSIYIAFKYFLNKYDSFDVSVVFHKT